MIYVIMIINVLARELVIKIIIVIIIKVNNNKFNNSACAMKDIF